MWHRRYPGNLEEWHRDLRSSTGALAGTDVALAVFDPLTGALLAATPGVAAVLGAELPATALDLVERGLVARPDLQAVADHLAAWRALDEIEGAGRESSHSWSTRLRAHPATGSVELAVDILHHRRPAIPAEAVVVTLHAGHHTTSTDAPNVGGILDRFWLVYDHQMRIVAADPRMARLGLAPEHQVGMLAAITVHPEDLPAVVPLVVAVINEQIEAAHYAVRIRGDQGWVRVQVELRRLLSPDGPMLVGAVQPLPDARRPLAPDALTPREAAVVRALFDGLRVATIAERDGVAVKTVRNQLAAIYRKLEVGGQEELLGTYTRPVG
ncbi:LuxR C-terminal-related transcriptional regulator [Aquihabitans sp. G128]|uniref:helix-turn-helix transcriptional regulator n=1 Tax=Aquihabitans sp. G128 TaxID=2849779 RepID=UPI001C245379|nr:LuxR C-terminal-related transcriptional regulator [Aquihabitans sp. G128]QXC59108.1 LuxR C-terminal-related transcriptional regulator [Aquihabitans sp. G128]